MMNPSLPRCALVYSIAMRTGNLFDPPRDRATRPIGRFRPIAVQRLWHVGNTAFSKTAFLT
jgi:hypothetical protein